MKKVIIILFLIFSVFGYSQKVKFKNGQVLIDDVAWLNYKGCGFSDTECSLLNYKGQELIFFKDIVVNDESNINEYNPSGSVKYIEVVFIGLNKKIEYKPFQKDLIKIFYNSKLINEEGVLDSEKVDALVEKYGTPFSDKLRNKTTIIINNND